MSKRVVPFVLVAGLVVAAVWYFTRAAPVPADSATDSLTAGSRAAAGDAGERDPLPAISVAPDFETESRASATGRVTDDTGRPVPGATVCATLDATQAPASHSRRPTCATTGTDGRYRLEELYPLLHRFDASAPRHRPSDHRPSTRLALVSLSAGQTATAIDFVLPRGGTRIRGTVRDISGGAIEAATVRATASDLFGKGGMATTLSDADGRFELWVRSGRITVKADADGYAPHSKSATAPGPEFELSLSPEAVVVGSVRRADTGEPVAGIEVELLRSGIFTTRAGSALTDASGRFRVHGLHPGVLTPTARSETFYGRADSVAVGLMETSDPVLIEVLPSTAVRGRVVIEETGEPCQDGMVYLRTEEDESLDAPIGDDGSVLFTPVTPGRYTVAPRCYSYLAKASYDVVVVTRDSVDVAPWLVSAGASIRGTVVDAAGDPVAGQMVVARAKAGSAAVGPAATTVAFSQPSAEDGSFEVLGVGAGVHAVSSPGGFGRPTLEPVDVEVADGEVVEGIELRLRESAELRGTVVDENGAPVVGGRVRARPDEGRGTHVFTDATGAFVLPDLPPGPGRVAVSEGRFDSPLRAPGSGSEDPKGQRYEVAAGEVREIELVVESVSGRITGQVVDTEGAPVSDAFVDLIRQSGTSSDALARDLAKLSGAWTHQPTLTDLSGEFTVEGVPEGTYTVQALRKGGGAGVASNVPSGGHALLEVLEPSRLSGTVALRGGGVPERFSVDADGIDIYVGASESYFRGEGRWSLGGLRPGRYRITAEGPDGTATAEVEVAAGEHRDGIELELAPRAEAFGRIVDLESGEPVAGRLVKVVPRGSGVSFGGAASETKKEITDADGRFEVSGAPTGDVMVSVTAAGADRAAEYPFLIFAPHHLDSSAGKRHDLGDIVIAKRRLDRRQRAGDLGYTLRERDRGVPAEQTKLVVEKVRDAGPAADCGLRPDDVIVAIDGHDVRGGLSYLYEALREVPQGTAVVLTLERGASVTITAGPPV